MSEDFLKNPLSLFDVKGKTAIVTGATGAFGAVAAKTLAASGANVVITANNADGLKKLAAECGKLGGKSEIVAKRPTSETNCDAIVMAAVEKFGGLDILVVASGQNKISKIVDQKPEDFLDVMDANVTQSWLHRANAGRTAADRLRPGLPRRIPSGGEVRRTCAFRCRRRRWPSCPHPILKCWKAFFARRLDMDLTTRAALAGRIATALCAKSGLAIPPETSVETFLEAVAHQFREQARMS